MNVFANRLAMAGVVLFAGTALTACGGESGTAGKPAGGAAPKSAEPVSAAETLKKGVPTGTTPAFRYVVKGGSQPLSGVLDGPNKSLTSGISQKIPDSKITMSMKFLIIDEKAWTRISFTGGTAKDGLPTIPDKWMSLDQSKMGGAAEELTYEGETDPGYVSTILEASTGIEEAGGVYTGTTDLSGSAEAQIVDEATLKALGAKAKTVPLTVTLDGEGRITRTVLKIPAAGKAKAATYEVVYDQYGTAAAIKEPAGVVKATADVYEMLKG